MDQNPVIEASFLKLYEELANSIYRHCYFRVGSKELAEDLMQEAFMRTWTYLAEGKTIDNPRAFLYRTAGNLVIDHYRRKKEVSLDKMTEDGFEPVGDDGQSVITEAFGREAMAMLEKLEPEYREMLVMRYVNDLSIKEIAIIVEQSENAVSVRIHRAIQKLKKNI